MIRSVVSLMLSLALSACNQGKGSGPDSPSRGESRQEVDSPVSYDEIASRTAGVAPLSVYFQAELGGGEAARKAFHHAHVVWDFDDDQGATYVTGHSRNTHIGPVAAHVFEKPGQYAVKASITNVDGTTAVKTVVINVQDPDTIFADKATVCVSQAGDFTGAPAGCEQVTTSDYATLGALIQPGRRILLRRGESWAAASNLGINVEGPGHVGSFGAGELPVINVADVGIEFGASTAFARDWRVSDLRLVGTTDASIGVRFQGQSDDILLLRLQGEGLHVGVSGSSSTLTYWNAQGDGPHEHHDGVALVDLDIKNMVGGGGGNGVFLVGRRLALLGSVFRNSQAAEHVLRLPTVLGGLIGYNELGIAAERKHVIKLHGPDFEGESINAGRYTERVQIVGNTFEGDCEDWMIAVGAQNDNEDERLRDIIVDRNTFMGSEKNQVAVFVGASAVTLRNNLFILQNGRAFNVGGRGLGPDPTDMSAYNNTVFSPSASAELGQVGSTPNSVLHNNLLVSFGQAPKQLGSSDNEQLNNLLTQEPLFSQATPQEPAHFVPLEGSPADNAGVPVVGLWTDHRGNARNPSTPDVGAFEN